MQEYKDPIGFVKKVSNGTVQTVKSFGSLFTGTSTEPAKSEAQKVLDHKGPPEDHALTPLLKEAEANKSCASGAKDKAWGYFAQAKAFAGKKYKDCTGKEYGEKTEGEVEATTAGDAQPAGKGSALTSWLPWGSKTAAA